MKAPKILAILLTLVMLLSTAVFTVSADIESAKAELAEAIENAERRIPPPGSNATGFGDLLDAIGEAELLLNNPEATELEIEEMIEKLENAGSGIIIRDFDNSKLWEAMEFANAIPEENYTAESYEYMKVLANDYLVLHYASSQQEIDDLTLDIYRAVKALVPVNGATVPALPYSAPTQETIALLLKAIEDGENALGAVGGNFNMETFYALQEALEEGQGVLSDADCGELDFLIAADDIKVALENLEFFHWDTDALWEVIQQYEGLEAEDYEATSYAVYAKAGIDARNALYYAQSQEEVDTAKDNLLKAVERLIKKDVRAHLEEELKKVEETIFVDGNNYTNDSLTTVGIAYSAATNLLKEDKASEDQLVQAINYLWYTIDALETEPSTDETEPCITTSATETTETTTVTEPTESTTSAINTTAPTETVEATEVTEEPVIITTTTPDEVTTSTAAKTESTTIPHTYTCYIVGDADGNEKINIKDATIIQKHLAKIVTLDSSALLAADGNEDLKVNIKDATEIQKYLANIPVGSNIGKLYEASSTTSPSVPETSTLSQTTSEEETTTSAQTTEKAEVTTSSTPATKDEIFTTDAEEESSEATTEATEFTEATETTVTTEPTEYTTEEPTETTTHDDSQARPSFYVYFTNTYNWDEVNIYYWEENNTSLQWPGVPMEYVRTNIYGHDIYRYDLHDVKAGIIFNNGTGENSEKTVDINYHLDKNTCFYPETLDPNGSWLVNYCSYLENSPCVGIPYIDFEVVRDVRLYSGYNGNYSNQTLMYIVRSNSDDQYKAVISEDELPELDTDTLAERGKALIIHLSFVGSGDASQQICALDVQDDTLTVLRTINVPKNGTPDMHYRLTAIEVNAEDVENIKNFSDATIYNYFNNL